MDSVAWVEDMTTLLEAKYSSAFPFAKPILHVMMP